MRHFRKLKLFIIVSLVFTISLFVLLLIRGVIGFDSFGFPILLYFFIAMGPNLLHILVSFFLTGKYYPNKELPRSFIILFYSFSVFGWISCIGLFFLLITVASEFFSSGDGDLDWNPFALMVYINLATLVIMMPFQFIASYKLLNVIQENHRKNLIDSFN